VPSEPQIAADGEDCTDLFQSAESAPIITTRTTDKKGKFGTTAANGRKANPDKKGNIRDYADVSQLVCLANLENLNALFINEALSQEMRLGRLNQAAIQQMRILTDDSGMKMDDGHGICGWEAEPPILRYEAEPRNELGTPPKFLCFMNWIGKGRNPYSL